MIRYRLVLWTDTQPIEEKYAKAVFNDFGEAASKNFSYSPLSGRVDSLFPRGERFFSLALEWKLAIAATAAIVLLVLVSVQLSYELSRQDAKIRRLAEESALIEERLRRLEGRDGGPSSP